MSSIDQSLSDLWREGRSKDRGTDLASVLDGARIIAQSLNPDTEVSFAGVSLANTDRKKICLSAGILGGEHPVPGNIVDVLLGLTVHEVGHTLFSEDKRKYDRLAANAGAYYHQDYNIFMNLVNTFEDIYIDHLMSAYPGYRDYLRKERAWALGKFNPDRIIKPLQTNCDRTDMLNALIYLALAGGKMPQGITDENFDALGKLVTCASKMCTKKLSKASAIVKAWKTLKSLPPGPAPPGPVNLASKLNALVDDNTELPDDIVKDVREAIIEKRVDLSQLLSHLAKDSSYTVIAYTPNEDAMRAAEVRGYTASAEEKLRRILQDYRLRRTRDYRGLMSGRISGRRLHRVAYGDQRVFQKREKLEEIDVAVCFLMDLSDSVHQYRDLIEQITVATSDAFKKEKMEFIALGYSENRNVVNIPRLYDKELGRVNLDLRKEWGSTPSYEGLAAATAQLLRLGGKKQKIVLHFTDGEPNVGGRTTIPKLLDEARSKGIIDIHICLTSSGFTSENFRRLYGEDTMFIDEIDQLPDVVDKELRRRLKV